MIIQPSIQQMSIDHQCCRLCAGVQRYKNEDNLVIAVKEVGLIVAVFSIVREDIILSIIFNWSLFGK